MITKETNEFFISTTLEDGALIISKFPFIIFSTEEHYEKMKSPNTDGDGIIDWCQNSLGVFMRDWVLVDTKTSIKIYISDEDQATLIQLTWG